MKILLKFVCFICFSYSFTMLNAQEKESNKNQSPIYDFIEAQLSNTDTVPDFEAQTNKLKITGVIFENDGITPAKDVLLYIYQANENGDYQINTKNKKRSVHHSAWVRTDGDGRYTIFTFIPGAAIDPITYPRRRGLKEIVPIIKENNNKPEYNLNSFLFDDDPAMTKSCRKRLKRKGIDNILKLEKEEDIYVATKNIILEKNIEAYK